LPWSGGTNVHRVIGEVDLHSWVAHRMVDLCGDGHQYV